MTVGKFETGTLVLGLASVLGAMLWVPTDAGYAGRASPETIETWRARYERQSREAPTPYSRRISRSLLAAVEGRWLPLDDAVWPTYKWLWNLRPMPDKPDVFRPVDRVRWGLVFVTHAVLIAIVGGILGWAGVRRRHAVLSHPPRDPTPRG